MGLKEVLEKMKIVEADEVSAPPPPPAVRAPQAPPPPVRTAASPSSARRPAMDEVLRGTPPTPPRIDEKALPTTAAGEVPDFAAIFKAAGVTDPAHGFSAYKVLEILSSPELAPLDPRAKAAALAGFLKMNPAGPVPIADVIKDAVARDQALDGFEDFLRKKLDDRRAQLDGDNAKLQAEIDEVTRRNREKMDANRRVLEAEKDRLAAWQTRKRIEERRLFDAVAPFVEANPVTLGGNKPDRA